jgi:excisionase family DNA binding protein
MRTTKATKRSAKIIPLNERGAYKLKEACEYLGGISPITVRRLMHRGLLRPLRILRHVMFSKAELDRFLAEGGGKTPGRRAA